MRQGNNSLEIDRDALLTKKDINNMEKRYNLTGVQKNSDDKTSVNLWVNALQEESDNPIIFYKAQDTDHGNLRNRKQDFLLCIQTPFQKHMMQEHARKLVCIDSTHSITQYDFLLTTILVIDDFQAGVPVAWAISNGEDANLLQHFFNAVRVSCGQDILTDVFMTDLACNFYNAWVTVFSEPRKRLFCKWHLQKSWTRKISLCNKYYKFNRTCKFGLQQSGSLSGRTC